MKSFLAKRHNLKLQVVFLILTSIFTVFGATGDVDTGFDPELIVDLENYNGNAVIQPDGRIIVFGSKRLFSSGSLRPFVVRINQDGSIDSTFDCTECGSINPTSITVQTDGKIVVSGGETINGQGRVIRVNQDGSLDMSFNSPLLGCSPRFIVSQPDNKTLLSCGITITRLNQDGSPDTSFVTIQSRSSSPQFDPPMILLPDGKILATGHLSNSSSWMNRYQPNGSIDNSFQLAFGSRIDSFTVLPNQNIMLGGGFSAGIARLFPDGSVDGSFSPTIASNENIRSIKALSNGQFYVNIYTDPFPVPGNRVYRYARYNADGSVDNTFSQAFLSASGILVDNFDRIVTPRSSLYRLNFDGTVDTSFNPTTIPVDGIATTAEMQSDGKIVVVGEFGKSNGTSSPRITRINSDGTTDTTFDVGSGFDVRPTALAIQPDGKILVSGYFTVYNGTPRTHIVRLNADGSLDNSFNPTFTSTIFTTAVLAIAPLPNGKILIGGNFATVNGATRIAMAQLNADGSLDTTFNTNFQAKAEIVYFIYAQSDGKIVVSGNGGLDRLNSDGSIDSSFENTNLHNGVGTNIIGNSSSISDIIQRTDGKYIISIKNIQTYFATVLLLNNNGERDFTFHPPLMSSNHDINSILQQPNGNIVFGGSYETINGRVNNNISRIGPGGQTDIYFPTYGTNGDVHKLLSQSDGKIVFVGEFTGIENVGRSGIARMTLSNRTSGTLFDFDGDGRADVSVFRPSTNVWYNLLSGDSSVGIKSFGVNGDIPAPADYDGDGKTDFGLFRPSVGDWLYISSSNNTVSQFNWGLEGDIPLPSDVSGDGKADLVVYRPSVGIWYRAVRGFVNFGSPGDKPVIGDFDGDGMNDPAIFRPSTGDWWYAASSAQQQHRTLHWGASEDIPVPGDYDGDGMTDYAVFRPSDGVWYILKSTGGNTILPFGLAGDKPVSADYDGDGKTDIAVYRPSDGIWYLLQSTDGFSGLRWGVSTDIPSQNAFTPE